MTALMVVLLAAVFIASARLAYRARHHRHAYQLHTQTDREVADNCRPHGALIQVAPAHAPRHTPTKVD